MKKNLIISALCGLICQLMMAAAPKATAQRVDSITLAGYVGHRYMQCLEHRVKTENLDTLISVFREQNEENNGWRSEFWGKWVQGAIGMYRYTHDEQLRDIIRQAQDGLIACQLPNGYLGDYDAQHQLTGWDVWGRKYTILGLLKWYLETGYKPSLKAAMRLLDYTISQIGPDGKSITQCGYYMGMPPCSILEPAMLMYQATHEKRYLQFAKYIVADMESEHGPQLIAKADVPVAQRFPLSNPNDWWSRFNGQKAYEMMSCYIGLLELFRATGDSLLLESAQKAYRHIVDEEINICGSGASYECWYGGRGQQHRVAMHTMETCVTFTWMQFCERLLEFTGDPAYADQIERTLYNALMASMKADGSQIVKYTPLEGYRQEGEHQCNMPINCCNANGTRAFAMIPRIMYRLPESGRIDVNLYVPSTAQVQMGKNLITLVQKTEYPRKDFVEIAVNPTLQQAFTIALRIPAWSQHTILEVNGEPVPSVQSGSYQLVNRVWKAGDCITLRVELQARLVRLNNMQAIERGPIVLARDSRFADGDVDESCIIPTRDSDIVDLEPIEAPAGIWMAFRVKMLRGAYSEAEADKEFTHFCDFASAGNTWDKTQRYRVWLPRTLNARFDP